MQRRNGRNGSARAASNPCTQLPQERTMKRIIGMAAAMLCGVSLSAMAAAPERADLKADKAQAKADYQAAKADCKKMDGDSRHDCKKEARANYKAAKKSAKATEEARDEAREHAPK